MGEIIINNLNDGINVKSDSSAISEGSLADCVGFDLTQEGVIKTAGGIATNNISVFLPATGTIACKQTFYIGSTRYILATTEVGLYANGVLVRAGFTGRFKGVSFLNNVYLVNGTFAVRFDGTACYQWGITAPTTMPTITTGTVLSQTIDDCETLATWIANQVNAAISAEAVIKKVGTQSMQINVAASTLGYSYVSKVKDLSRFDATYSSNDQDYIAMWVQVDALANLEQLVLYFDIGDGTFASDYYSYTIVSPGAESQLQAYGMGKTADVVSEDTVISGGGTIYVEQDPIPVTGYPKHPYIYPEPIIVDVDKVATITKETTRTVIDPTITDQVLNFYRRSSLFSFQSNTWKQVKIPKRLFLRTGDNTKTWADVCAMKIVVATNANGAVNVYLDDIKLMGGSDLVGEYWFMYTWARTDSNGNILHESMPSVNNTTKQFNISGPVVFDKEPLVYSNRPLSSDPQVNAGILYAIGGNLTDFWQMVFVNDNTTASGTEYNTGERFISRRLNSKRNEPAPAGTDLVLYKNKIWMVGDSTYPRLVRSSEILEDGTLAPEGWPTRNAYEPEENNGNLTNIKIVNKIPIVKGTFGEWRIEVLDPVDYLQIRTPKVSSLGLIGQDAVIDFETSNIYPSARGFVESDGNNSKFVLPEIQPLIEPVMSSAIGINAGLVSYFTYTHSTYGPRTAKVDLYRGKPRFTNINNKLFECLEYDSVVDIVYGVENGNVYMLDSGSSNESVSGGELYAYMKSRTYRVGRKVGWNRVELVHNTGGIWYQFKVYVDEVLICSTPFRSTTRTTTNFRDFGPVSGYDFQFVLEGNYNQPGTIYFPIRIFHSGK